MSLGGHGCKLKCSEALAHILVQETDSLQYQARFIRSLGEYYLKHFALPIRQQGQTACEGDPYAKSLLVAETELRSGDASTHGYLRAHADGPSSLCSATLCNPVKPSYLSSLTRSAVGPWCLRTLIFMQSMAGSPPLLISPALTTSLFALQSSTLVILAACRASRSRKSILRRRPLHSLLWSAEPHDDVPEMIQDHAALPAEVMQQLGEPGHMTEGQVSRALQRARALTLARIVARITRSGSTIGETMSLF